MLRLDIPCAHRLGLLHNFPEFSHEIKLKLNASIDTLELEIHYEPQNIQETHKNEHERIVSIAVKNIRKYSHYKKKNEIKTYVEEHFGDENAYVFDYSVSLVRVISDGIHHFTEKKKTNADLFSSDSSQFASE